MATVKDPFRKLFSNIKLAGFEIDDSGKLLYTQNAPGTSGHKVIYERLKNGEDVYYDDIKHDHRIKYISLSIQQLKMKWKEQDYRCHWLDIPLKPQWIFEPSHPGSLSCDRLDNNGHYTYDNVVITCRFANLGRNSATVGKFNNWLDYVKTHLKSDELNMANMLRHI